MSRGKWGWMDFEQKGNINFFSLKLISSNTVRSHRSQRRYRLQGIEHKNDLESKRFSIISSDFKRIPKLLTIFKKFHVMGPLKVEISNYFSNYEGRSAIRYLTSFLKSH